MARKAKYEERSAKPLHPKTETQRHYISAIRANTITFGTGPAGTGKTYCCTALAAQALLDNPGTKLYLTRPVVEAGESLGFLPGTLAEKYEPYLAPFRQTLNEVLGASHVEALIHAGRIEPIPLAFMRGLTFKNAWVILDEAQNTTKTQMKLFLTRIGEYAKVVVNGDLDQKDIEGPSGLEDAVLRLNGVPGITTVAFTKEEIVRSSIVRDILERYT